MNNTYWNNQGKHQLLADKLIRLIPASGPVYDPRGSNRQLEKFRKAANCYYDLFNNGLCNRSAEFRRVFGFSGFKFASLKGHRFSPSDFDAIHKKVEPLMDAIILAAAAEQGYSQGGEQ